MLTVLLMLAALALDRLFGEPRRWHPLVGYGRFADWLERHFNTGGGSRLRGMLAWLLAVIPLALLAWLLATLPVIGWVCSLILLYLAIGLRSLGQHAAPIADALNAADLPLARERVGYMVSRQTDELDAEAVAAAATESVLENGSDAAFAALFWFALLGAPGVVLYRLANTLDAMWGYRNERFMHFGWAAARADDLLNYLPARLVALTYALCGSTRAAFYCWRRQAPLWDSPNAGPVMAAGAGALGVRLGGPAVYHGQLHERPVLGLGLGRRPGARDIHKALSLVHRGVGLWLGAALGVATIFWGLIDA